MFLDFGTVSGSTWALGAIQYLVAGSFFSGAPWTLGALPYLVSGSSWTLESVSCLRSKGIAGRGGAIALTYQGNQGNQT